jgi:hypothetical protein
MKPKRYGFGEGGREGGGGECHPWIESWGSQKGGISRGLGTSKEGSGSNVSPGLKESGKRRASFLLDERVLDAL